MDLLLAIKALYIHQGELRYYLCLNLYFSIPIMQENGNLRAALSTSDVIEVSV